MQTILFRRDFTLVVIGQIISLFGNAILRFALPLYLLRETGSSTLFGVVTACSFAPMVILSMVGGVLADRVNKRDIMVGLDFSTAAIIMLFYFSLGKIPTVPLFIVVLMLLYGISGTYQPAVQASVPLLVSKDKLMAGNAVINQVNTLSGLLGPVIGGVMAGAALLLGIHLIRMSSGMRRAESYLKFMDGWVGCTLAELSQHTHLPVSHLAKDLTWLIKHRVLTGVWLDLDGEILFTDASAYQEYLAQRRGAAKQDEKAAPTDESAEAVLAQGRSFLRQTAQLRTMIEDVQVHARVVQMEQIVQNLLDWVQENPGGASKLRRLTRYYLPTTLKLLRTYTSVDDNPGEKARQICQEIDRILDTVNQALLQLQDTLLEDTALDVSAEISALESMLAQEGLTGPSLDMAASAPYVPGVKGNDGRL